MSTTDTTTTTGLRLARFRTEQDARGFLPSGRGLDYSTEDSRTFFVDDYYDGYMSPGSGGTHTTMIVPMSDPRHSGMWEATGDHEGSHGWNVPRDALEYLDTPTPPTDDPAEESYVPQVGDLVEIVKTLVPSCQDRYGGMVGEVKRFDASDNSWLVDLGVEGVVWSTELRKVEGDAAALASPAVRQAIREAVKAERDKLTRTFEAWKEEATRVAHEYADNNSLCSEFDRCMADIGLQGRERRWTVEGTFTMIIDATSADEARAEAERLLEDYVYSVDATEAEIG